jgi:hypothetical protein
VGHSAALLGMAVTQSQRLKEGDDPGRSELGREAVSWAGWVIEKGNEEATTGWTKIVRWAKTRKDAEEFFFEF